MCALLFLSPHTTSLYTMMKFLALCDPFDIFLAARHTTALALCALYSQVFLHALLKNLFTLV